MKYYLLPYSLKVWLTSVLLAPIIFLFIDYFTSPRAQNNSQTDIDSLIQLYLAFVIAGAILSFITWLIFWGVAILTCRHTTNIIQRKLIMFFMGIILTILTFLLLFSSDEAFSSMPYGIMLSNCFCIGAGSLFYDLGLD